MNWHAPNVGHCCAERTERLIQQRSWVWQAIQLPICQRIVPTVPRHAGVEVLTPASQCQSARLAWRLLFQRFAVCVCLCDLFAVCVFAVCLFVCLLACLLVSPVCVCVMQNVWFIRRIQANGLPQGLHAEDASHPDRRELRRLPAAWADRAGAPLRVYGAPKPPHPLSGIGESTDWGKGAFLPTFRIESMGIRLCCGRYVAGAYSG